MKQTSFRPTHILTTKDGTHREVYFDWNQMVWMDVSGCVPTYQCKAIRPIKPVTPMNSVDGFAKEETYPFWGLDQVAMEEGGKRIDKAIKDMKEEILDWRQAARLWSEGVSIQFKFTSDDWSDITNEKEVWFIKTYSYRRKPVEPAPDYSKDQGFRLGDIIMASNDGEFWKAAQYSFHKPGHFPHQTPDKEYKYARPLNSEEARRVRVIQKTEEAV